MSLGYRGYIGIGMLAAAMVIAAAGGCVTHPPPGTEGPGTSAAPMSARPTSVERRAALDKQLNDSLNAFDARLRQEQLKTAQDRDARQATVAATTTPASTSGAADGTEAAIKARTERPGDLKSEKSVGGTSNVAGNGATATVVPDGNDDDIVARRLRKAADQETDPELKDKLWKEYVQYKKNTQVR